MARKKKEEMPEFVYALDNTPARNYSVYKMKPLEKILYFLLAFAVGAFIGYVFYGGLAKDEFNNPTTMTYILDVVICGGLGLLAGFAYIPMRTKQLAEKRRNLLRRQFRELLDTLTTSISSGKSVHDSFVAAYDDLGVIYSDEDYIMQELLIIRRGLANSVVIEDLLNDFGIRSGIDDIISFAGVFETCSRRGGNMKDIIHSIQDILNGKMAVEEQIATVLSSSVMEQYIMLVMPVFIVAIIKFSSEDFAANFTSAAGLAATTIGVVLFAGAFALSRVIMNIKV